MKNYFVIQILILFTLSAVAQKIQIKKGIIYIDKEPIAKLTGEVKSIKDTHVVISDLSDQPLLQIDEIDVKFGSWFQRDFGFYNLKFPTLNKSVSAIVEQFGKSTGSEKKLLEQLYDSIGNKFLTRNGLNTDQVYAFIKMRDASHRIKMDTLYINELIRISRERLGRPIVDRPHDAIVRLIDRKNPLEWRGNEYWRNTTINSKVNVADIYQGNSLLGVLIKVLEMDYKGFESFVKESHYYILRKVDSFEIENNRIEFASLASLDCSVIISLQVEGRSAVLDYKVIGIENAEMQLIHELIADGLL